MDDLKKEDGLSRYDIIHDDNVRQGSTKRKLLDQVSKYTQCIMSNITQQCGSITYVCKNKQ